MLIKKKQDWILCLSFLLVIGNEYATRYLQVMKHVRL